MTGKGERDGGLPFILGMDGYIGVERVMAKAMTRFGYNSYRGWLLNCGEYGDEPGYAVRKKSGNVSWAPARIFEELYTSTKGMSFGVALEAMKQGVMARRDVWRPLGARITLVPGGHIELFTREGRQAWAVSQSDVLANDWQVVV